MKNNRNSTFFAHNFSPYLISKHKKRKLILPEQLKNVSSYLMRENYLIHLDDLLYTKFIVAVNPKGKKCLLISFQQQEYLISETGKILMMLNTNLPKDSSSSINTMIECTFTGNKLILQDLLKWDNQDFRSNSVETRFKALSTNFSLISQNSIKIIVEEYFQCDLNSFEYCYNSHKDYLKDGISFYKSESIYKPGLADSKYVWKDNYCAIIEEYEDKFQISASKELLTSDGFTVHKLSSAYINKISGFDRMGQVVCAEVLEIGSYRLEKIGNIKESKGRASSWTEVVFYYKLSKGDVKVEDIYDVLKKETEMEIYGQDYFDSEEFLEYNNFDLEIAEFC